MYRKFIICLAAILFCVVTVYGEDPWSFAPNIPTFVQPKLSTTGARKLQLTAYTAENASIIWLAFYQHGLSVVSNSKCRMLPSCSNYSIQAIRKHGSLIGIMMTCDRLLHEADEQKLHRVVYTRGLAFCPDPVSNNDFWWYP